jgi:hypothetical protein
MTPNGLLDTSLVTNLQKTSKQKPAGNAATSDKCVKKISVFLHRNFLQKNTARYNNVYDIFYVLEYPKIGWKCTEIKCKNFRG